MDGGIIVSIVPWCAACHPNTNHAQCRKNRAKRAMAAFRLSQTRHLAQKDWMPKHLHLNIDRGTTSFSPSTVQKRDWAKCNLSHVRMGFRVRNPKISAVSHDLTPFHG